MTTLYTGQFICDDMLIIVQDLFKLISFSLLNE